jgi:hypothetical protein
MFSDVLPETKTFSENSENVGFSPPGFVGDWCSILAGVSNFPDFKYSILTTFRDFKILKMVGDN